MHLTWCLNKTKELKLSLDKKSQSPGKGSACSGWHTQQVAHSRLYETHTVILCF